jgi:hypothetical protein
MASSLPDLRACDFFNVYGLKTRAELRVEYQLDLTVDGYVKLTRCLNHYVTRLRPNNRNNGSAISIPEFFLTIKKPGKKIRSALAKPKRKDFDPSKLPSFSSFLSIVELRIDDFSFVSRQVSLWNTYGIPHTVGSFIFKFYNNILGTNARLFHFVPGISKNCTLCSLKNIPNPESENFLHIFFNCPVVTQWNNAFLTKYFPEIQLPTDREKKMLLFLGRVPVPHGTNNFIALTILIFQFCVWEAKLKKKLHSFITLDILFQDKILSLIGVNKKIRKIALKTNLSLRRHFLQHPPVEGPIRIPAGNNRVLPDV